MLYQKDCPRCGDPMIRTSKDTHYCDWCDIRVDENANQFFLIWVLMAILIMFGVASKPAEANDEVKYMAEAIYFEARNQALVGQVAVGCVIKNRVEHRRWANNVRDVVHQPKHFSYYSDGKPEVYNDTKAHYIAVQMALHVLNSDACDMYDKIDHYINHDIANPKATWYKQMKFIMKVGEHSFYKSIK